MQRQLGVFLYDTLNYKRIGFSDLEHYLNQKEIPGPEMRNNEALTRVLIPHKFGREIFERLDLMGISARAVQFSRQPWHSEDEIEVERGAPAGVFDVVASGAPEQIVGEGAQPGGDVRVLANA